MQKIKSHYPIERHDRIVLFVIGVTLIAICGLLNFTYRPYIYSHHIDDFHIADSFDNFLAVPAIQCLFLSFSKSFNTQIYKQIIAICLGLIIYEFIGLTFDIYDIFATLLSGFITYVVEIKLLTSSP